ncbi:MAG: VanZ family protein [Terrisporobacter othiniensis]|uniref:VanZ family protein n=1 Tax=Terrisporobacter othiniensis TaxID=1577792 RepID=UPI00290E6CD0|nr:VanZ family protein [Terrisporobacter othiniensis]MDU6983232.1 VanZ family protein [Terrisporobacter othiniensis]
MKKVIYILLLIMSIGAMHYFSSQNGSTSKSQSNAVVEIIDEIRDKVTLKDEKLIKIKDTVMSELKKYSKSMIVRKAAHFSMYAIIGGISMLVIYSFSKQVFLSACLSFTFSVLFAVFDERSQIAIDGRNGNLTDVFIDSSGALLSICILSILFITTKGIKHVFRREEW